MQPSNFRMKKKFLPDTLAIKMQLPTLTLALRESYFIYEFPGQQANFTCLTQHIQIVHISFTQYFNCFSQLHMRRTLTVQESILIFSRVPEHGSCNLPNGTLVVYKLMQLLQVSNFPPGRSGSPWRIWLFNNEKM